MSLESSVTASERAATERFLLRLAQALHAYGIPAHRLEQAMSNIADSLGVSIQTFSMPTGLFVAFQNEDNQRTHLLRVSVGDLNLEKQCDIDELVERLIAGEFSIDEAREQLDQIKQKPPRYPRWLAILAFLFTALAVARMYNGGVPELIVSGLGGLLCGFITMSLGGHSNISRLIPALASFSTSLLITTSAFMFGPIAQSACHMSSVMILIPGLSLTVAITELSTQNLVSGTARLASSIEVLFQIGFGLALGSYIGEYWFGVLPNVTISHLPGWTFWLIVPCAGLSFLILFQARPKDIVWITLACFVAITASDFGLQVMGPRLGPFLGALLVSLFSNLFARLRRRPASLIMVPSLILLVPGSIGVNSISAMLKQNTLGGLDAAFTMFMVAVSLVFGILIAALLLPPRRSL